MWVVSRVYLIGSLKLMSRSRAAFLRTALLEIQVSESREGVRHEPRLLLFRHDQDKVYEALCDQARKGRSVGTACGDPLLHHVDDRAVQALLRLILRRRRQPFDVSHGFPCSRGGPQGSPVRSTGSNKLGWSSP